MTIRYEGTSCRSVSAVGQAVTEVEGTATVFTGRDASGEAIDVRPFSSSEVAAAPPSEASGWWSCGGPSLRYRWTMSEVYEFSASGGGGHWTFRQTAFTPDARSSGSSFDACRIR